MTAVKVPEAFTLTMTSREIAELVKSSHDSVLKTIRRLVQEGVVSGNETPYTHEQNGQTYTEFVLNFRDTMIVASGYSVDLRARVIDRWQELETKAAKPAELSRMDILKLAMESEQRAIEAEASRDLAIATKAQIGSKREATAMATASAAKRESTKLKDQLGFNARHATVRVVEKATGEKFAWQPLRKWCKVNGVPAANVPDPLYITVKAWPADAWGTVYGIDLEYLFSVEEVAE